MNEIRNSILKVLSYYDIFQYPLTRREIRSFMGKHCSEDKLILCLAELSESEVIFETEGFYSIRNDVLFKAQRIKENAAAEKQLKLAKRIAYFLTWFPYVKGIAISGSLSKQVAKEDSDIDFFLITKTNRLWISKIFLLILIKFASLLRLDTLLCINYIVDESSLEVPEKNIFTATEIITLLPVYGQHSFNRFIEANNWVYSFFPNHKSFNNPAKEINQTWLGKSIEYFFDSELGDKIDSALLHYFDKRWKRLMSKNKFKKTGFQIGAVMADKHFCRPYPEHFQKKILQLYESKLKELNLSHSPSPVVDFSSFSFS